VGHEMSVLHLFLQASWIVKAVMLLLVLASVASWAIIFQQVGELARARRAADGFEERFWSGINLTELYAALTRESEHRRGLAAVFEAGFREFSRLKRQQPDAVQDVSLLLTGAERAMRVAASREMERVEGNVSLLASIGSVSPYVGLFGTVWGIMNAFTGLANVQNATLQAVAPGIAEALVATAAGLFAAIPAVLAYNRFTEQADRLALRYDAFREEFIALLQRQVAR